MNAQLPNAAELADLPLTDDAAVLERVATVLRSASRRQVWLLLLDDCRCLLPTLIPMNLPPRPDHDAASAFVPMLGALLSLADVAHLVLVYERPGPDTPSRDDLAWLAAFAEAIELAAGSVLGLCFATDPGVRRWELHHDAVDMDAMMQDWPDEDDHHPDAGGAAARGAGDA